MSRRIVRTAVTIIGALFSLMVIAAPESLAASSPHPHDAAAPDTVYLNLGHFNGSNVRIRSTPSTNSPTVYGLGQKGQSFCFNDFVYNNSWLWGYRGSTHPGYVAETYITYADAECELV